MVGSHVQIFIAIQHNLGRSGRITVQIILKTSLKCAAKLHLNNTDLLTTTFLIVSDLLPQTAPAVHQVDRKYIQSHLTSEKKLKTHPTLPHPMTKQLSSFSFILESSAVWFCLIYNAVITPGLISSSVFYLHIYICREFVNSTI